MVCKNYLYLVLTSMNSFLSQLDTTIYSTIIRVYRSKRPKRHPLPMIADNGLKLGFRVLAFELLFDIACLDNYVFG